MKAQFFFI